ncbi:MAG: flavodoxin family protein [Verrucomicrobia bacterium]|nr:flavodoxin family protein [Verrucomicrobiota bacterium]MBR5690380.1 flavodoxin family protein [Verrucomicrobiota bacterium]
MKVVAFNGSPRKNGNTEFLLNTVLGVLAQNDWETEYIQVGGVPVRGCMACYKCFKNANARCVINVDPVNQWIAKAEQADAILLGSPSYFTNVSSELKAFMDRLGLAAYSVEKSLLKGKIGAGVVTHRRGGATCVFDQLNHFFLCLGMIVPGSSYFNFGVGRLPGDVREDQEAIANMKHLGEAINWLGRLIQTAPTAYPLPPTIS